MVAVLEQDRSIAWFPASQLWPEDNRAVHCGRFDSSQPMRHSTISDIIISCIVSICINIQRSLRLASLLVPNDSFPPLPIHTTLVHFS